VKGWEWRHRYWLGLLLLGLWIWAVLAIFTPGTLN
jgi:hypothetical protein